VLISLIPVVFILIPNYKETSILLIL